MVLAVLGESRQLFSEPFQVVKLVRLLKDTTWAEESPFQFFIMGVILCNAVLVGVQMNHADLEILKRLDCLKGNR